MDPGEGNTYWEGSVNPDFPPLYDSVTGKEQHNKKTPCQRINRELLPFKAFYFFFYGAIGSLFPFIALYYKHLWLSASQVGLLVGLRPIVQSLAAPLWGIFADKRKAKKIVLILGLCGWLFTNISILLVPPGEKPRSCDMNATAMNQMTKRSLDNSYSSFDKSSKETSERRRLERNARGAWHEDSAFRHVSRQQDYQTVSMKNEFETPRDLENLSGFPGSDKSSHFIPSTIKSTRRPVLKDTTTKDGFNSDDDNLQKSIWSFNDDRQPIKTWRTFAYIVFIIILGNVFSAPTQTMANTATLQGLKAETHKYGLQRYFGSIGWGCAAFVVGMLVSLNHDETLACKGLDDINYTPCFFAFGIVMLFALVVALFFKFEEEGTGTEEPVGIWKNLRQQLDCLTCFVLFIALFAGFNMGFIQTFLFWHLQSLGGTQTLFSIITAFNAIGEMIGFLLSVKLIEKLGHLKVMSIGLAAYTIRLLVCGLVKNPWLVLTVEMLKAFTSSAIWASVLSFVGVSSGSGATLQSVLHMLYWGLGFGGGGMLGGILTEYIGTSKVFVGLAIVSLLNMLVIVLIINLKCCPNKKRGIYMPLASDGEDMEEEEDENDSEN